MYGNEIVLLLFSSVIRELIDPKHAVYYSPELLKTLAVRSWRVCLSRVVTVLSKKAVVTAVSRRIGLTMNIKFSSRWLAKCMV